MTNDEILGLAAYMSPIETGDRRLEIALQWEASTLTVSGTFYRRGELTDLVSNEVRAGELIRATHAKGVIFATGTKAAIAIEFAKVVARGEMFGTVVMDLLVPSLLRRAELQTPEAFTHALVNGRVCREVELEDFAEAVNRELPDAGRLADMQDVALIADFMEVYTRWYTVTGATKALRQIVDEQRRHLAPVLRLYLDRCVDNPNLWGETGPEIAMFALALWDALPAEWEERWKRLPRDTTIIDAAIQKRAR